MVHRSSPTVLPILSSILLVAAAALPALAREPAARVPPGGVVRWSAPGTAACGMGSERWKPLEETCWYPIDLLHEPGSVEVVRWRGGTRETAHVHVGDYPYEVQHIELRDDSRVHLSEDDLARARREGREVGALWSRRGPRLFELPLAGPLDPLPEGGRFGARRFFNGEPRSPHTGADYKARAGAPVRAAAAGVVALADHHFFAGKSVFLDHGDGLITMYFHLSEIAVEAGARVERGQRIGAVGSTGRSTAPHLHFGVRWRGERVDPAMLLAPATAPAVAP
ncbi:MAG: M23 family metallopeptidase [Acidobacteriota bacterium]|jgi:hypothetical protein